MKSILLLSSLCLAGLSSADELPLLFQSAFTNGDLSKWEPVNPEGWKITKLEDKNHVLENTGKTGYKPPHRSPRNIALLKDVVVGDFVLTARVQTNQESRGHRDMCLFFGHQDASNFYYVHLGEKRDDHSNQIFIVDDAPRIKISEKSTEGTPWVDGKWHRVKIVRKVDDGLIEVYFDDMKTPTHVAHDKTFTRGRIGLGTFDDLGLWDDVELRGKAVKPE
ncbi:MAG: hypothetical protein HKN23_10620 [Verrucomicrobiales bacterium]|nr:hypothetical protein [Verrucomicrobiales bacterium]